ncbi:phage tail tape measure protein [Hafnia alvei]|uniref:phage tail tape measure protein n=1 Tax=Hafnia alvei TaxID=569 RepID=UPI0024A7C0D6|nr:phage tail tape measure protein [Hafnia alvei]
MKQLEFTLSLIDKLTRPLKQAQGAVKGFAENSQAHFAKVGIGAAALWGVGQTIQGALSPAIEMYDALQEASARGVDDTALKSVRDSALTFSMQYGRSAVEFVQSTADINAAIIGLTGDELPKVTKTANIVATALKTTAGEAAEFMGQMFGEFNQYAQQVGKVQFAEELAGKMAYMKQTFGTDMATIKDLMEGARGVGSNYGVGMDEQLAVLGQLQRTLGTEASSSYEGFMTGAAEGAKKLGLSFTDTNGKLLAMPAMLEKLQGKYGASIEGNLKAQAELDAAFGDSSAVIKHLYGNVDVLQRNITELGGSDGLKRAQEMATKMVKPWDRLMQVFTAIRTVIGLTLIPVLYPVLNKLAEMGATFARWMQLFPNIARVVGYAAMALLSFAAVGAIANIVMGVSGFIMMGLKGVWTALTAVTKIHIAVQWLCIKALSVWSKTMKIVRGVMLALRIAAMLTGIAFNFMSWPILLIIGAIALLVAGCYYLIKYWDDIKRAVMDTAAFQSLINVMGYVGDIFKNVWASIVEGWHSVVSAITGFSLGDAMSGMVSGISELFNGLWASMKQSFSSSYDWIIEKLNLIPGVDISASTASDSVPEMPSGLPASQVATAPAAVVPDTVKAVPVMPQGINTQTVPNVVQSVPVVPGNVSASPVMQNTINNVRNTQFTRNNISTGNQVKGIERGGLNKEINNNNKKITDNSKSIGTVNIYPKEMMSSEKLMEWQELGA